VSRIKAVDFSGIFRTNQQASLYGCDALRYLNMTIIKTKTV